MKYPRLPKKLDRRCKLTEKDIHQIRMLKENDVSNLEIAGVFNVSRSLIHYWTNEEYRQRVIEKAKKCRIDKEIKRRRQLESVVYRRSLPKFGKLWERYQLERIKERKRKDPEKFRRYNKEQVMKWRARHPEEYKKYQRDYYRKKVCQENL